MIKLIQIFYRTQHYQMLLQDEDKQLIRIIVVFPKGHQFRGYSNSIPINNTIHGKDRTEMRHNNNISSIKHILKQASKLIHDLILSGDIKHGDPSYEQRYDKDGNRTFNNQFYIYNKQPRLFMGLVLNKIQNKKQIVINLKTVIDKFQQYYVNKHSKITSVIYIQPNKKPRLYV